MILFINCVKNNFEVRRTLVCLSWRCRKEEGGRAGVLCPSPLQLFSDQLTQLCPPLYYCPSAFFWTLRCLCLPNLTLNFRECVRTSAAAARTPRSFGRHLLHPHILRLLKLLTPLDFEAQSSLL